MSNWAEKIGSTVNVTLPWGLTRVTNTTGTIERVTASKLIIVKTAEGQTLRFKGFGTLSDHPYRDQYGTYANGRRAMMGQQKEDSK